MKKDHPLDYILRMRKPKMQDLDSAFDLVCAMNYLDGQFGNTHQVDKNREIWEKLKHFLLSPHHTL